MKCKCITLTLICSTILLELNALGDSSHASDPKAERLWKKCVQVMRTAQSFDAGFTHSFNPDNSIGKKGHIHMERSGKILWSFRADHSDPPRSVVMKSDGKKAVITNSTEAKPDHSTHADFFHMFVNSGPAAQQFYERDGLTRYRTPGTPVRWGGMIRIGKEQCRVIEVSKSKPASVTRFYISPNGVYHGYRRTYRQSGMDYETEEVCANVKVAR